jgi:hypothetical protein
MEAFSAMRRTSGVRMSAPTEYDESDTKGVQ